MPDAPAPPINTSPAEQAIAESKAAYEAFLQQANDEIYVPAARDRQQASLNNVGDAMQRVQSAASTLTQPFSSAGDRATSPPRNPDGTFAPRASTAQTGQTTTPPNSTAAAASPPAPTHGATQAPVQSAPATIPGPPSASPPATAPSSQAVAQAPAGPQPSAQPSPSAPAGDDFSDVAPSTALDQPGATLRAKDWKRLHAKADTYLAQAGELRRQLDALRAAPAAAVNGTPAPEVKAQLEQLQRERDELRSTVERVAFEQSPQFKQMFATREASALLMAKQAVGPERAEQIAKVVVLPESAYRNGEIAKAMAAIAEDDPIRANKLGTAVSILDQLHAEKAVVLENSKSYIAQLTAQQAEAQQRAQAERQQRTSQTFDAELANWRTSNLIDDAGAATARSVYNGNLSLEEVARAAMWVAAGPKLAATATQLQQQLDAANAELGRLRAVQPGAASDAGGSILADNEPDAVGPVRQGMYAEGIIKGVLAAGLPLR